MAESRCIICGERRNGLEVNKDHIIDAIRWFKRNVTKNERNYRLTVCKDCYPKYKKSRDSYLWKEAAYTAIGLIFAAVLVIASSDRLASTAYGAAIVLMMYLLSQLSYMPGVRTPAARKR